MRTVVLLQPSSPRDPADDASLQAVAAVLTERAEEVGVALRVVTATDEPAPVAARTGLPGLALHLRPLLPLVAAADDLVVIGGVLGGRTPGGALLRAWALTRAGRWRGTRVSLIGASVVAPQTRWVAALLRGLVRGSALTVVGDRDSAAALEAAGVPGPVRVGPHPWWLAVGDAVGAVGADDPSPGTAPGRPRGGTWCTVTADDLERAGGPAAAAARVTALLDGPSTSEVLVQPWRSGPGGADDSAAARAVVTHLVAHGHPARSATTALAPAGLAAAVAGRALVVAGQPLVRAAAALAGVPVAGWDPAAAPPLDPTRVLERQDAARDVLVLLSVLVTDGRAALTLRPSGPAPDAPDTTTDRHLRPLGVLR